MVEIKNAENNVKKYTQSQPSISGHISKTY